ncbi:hypothetical protein JOQ06_000723, partial [Pogonophryne albipinna]
TALCETESIDRSSDKGECLHSGTQHSAFSANTPSSSSFLQTALCLQRQHSFIFKLSPDSTLPSAPTLLHLQALSRQHSAFSANTPSSSSSLQTALCLQRQHTFIFKLSPDSTLPSAPTLLHLQALSRQHSAFSAKHSFVFKLSPDSTLPSAPTLLRLQALSRQHSAFSANTPSSSSSLQTALCLQPQHSFIFKLSPDSTLPSAPTLLHLQALSRQHSAFSANTPSSSSSLQTALCLQRQHSFIFKLSPDSTLPSAPTLLHLQALSRHANTPSLQALSRQHSAFSANTPSVFKLSPDSTLPSAPTLLRLQALSRQHSAFSANTPSSSSLSRQHSAFSANTPSSSSSLQTALCLQRQHSFHLQALSRQHSAFSANTPSSSSSLQTALCLQRQHSFIFKLSPDSTLPSAPTLLHLQALSR